MLQVIQDNKTGTLQIIEIPAPVVREKTLLIQTVTSVVSAGTERHLVEMAQKNLLEKAFARPDLVQRVWEKFQTDGIVETIQQVRYRLDGCFPLGYSASGVVTALGEGVSGFQLGDWVVKN